MSVDFEWGAHTPVELRRRATRHTAWHERQHPRDGEGKFAHRGGGLARAEKRVAKFEGKVGEYDAAKSRFEKHGYAGPNSNDPDKMDAYNKRLERDPAFLKLEDQKERDEIAIGGGRPTPGRRTQRAQGKLAAPQYTRGQKVEVRTKTFNGKDRKLKGTIASHADPGGNYTVHVDNGVNGRRAKYHHSQITPTETRNRARVRNGAVVAAVPALLAANYYATAGTDPVADARNAVQNIKQRKNNRDFERVMRGAGWKGRIRGVAPRSRA